MAKKKQPKVKRDKSYDPNSEPDFHEEAVLMDRDGKVIDPMLGKNTASLDKSSTVAKKVVPNAPEHLSPLVETNDDGVLRDKEDEKEMAKKIADLSKTKNAKVVEKPAHIQAAPASAKTDGQKIWGEIKNLPIDMFGLPNQKVHQYCEPIDLVPAMCFLKQSFSSVLPMLEIAVGKSYTCEMQGQYVVVKRAVKPL